MEIVCAKRNTFHPYGWAIKYIFTSNVTRFEVNGADADAFLRDQQGYWCLYGVGSICREWEFWIC